MELGAKTRPSEAVARSIVIIDGGCRFILVISGAGFSRRRVAVAGGSCVILAIGGAESIFSGHTSIAETKRAAKGYAEYGDCQRL